MDSRIIFTKMSSRNSENCQIPEDVHGLRVLLVDGDSSALLYVASVLEEHFYNVKTTKFPSVALSMIQEGDDEFDLVMVDIGMTGMDIFTFLNRVLVTSDMPVIFMSMHEDDDMVTKALSEGACFFFLKPICRRDIINVWQHVYRKRTISQKIESRKAARGKEVVPENDPRVEKFTVVDSSFENVERNYFLGTGSENISTDRRGKSRIEAKVGFHRVWGNQDRQSPQKARIVGVERENQGVSSRKRGSCSSSYGGRSEERSDFKGLESIEDGGTRKDSDDSSSPNKRSRMKWTPSLHLKFMDTIGSMGDGKVPPRTVLMRMNEPTLSVRQVGSHLQDMPAPLSNFYSVNGFTAGIMDQHNPTMQTGGVFSHPHSPIGAAIGHFGTGASSVVHNHCSSLGGHRHEPPPPGYAVPLYQKQGTPPNSDTSAHYTLKTLRKALKSADLTGKRDSSSNANNMFNAPVQTANNREPFYGLNGLSLSGPNDTSMIGNADEIYGHENQQLLGFEWSTQNFTPLSPLPGGLSDWTSIYPFADVLTDVPQHVLDPFDQDLNPLPQYNLQSLDQLAAQGTGYFEGQSSNYVPDPFDQDLNPLPQYNLQNLEQLAALGTGYFEGQSSNSSSVRNSSSFASNQELIPPNPGSFSDLLNLVGGHGEVNRELNREPEIGEDDFDRYLEWFCTPDSGNDYWP